MRLQALVLLTRLFPSVPNSIVTHSYCGTHIEEPILAKLLKQARLRFLQTVSADPWHGYHPASQGDCIVLFWRPSLRGWTQKSNTRLHRLHFVWERLFPRVGWSRCLRSKNCSLFRLENRELCSFARAWFTLKTATTGTKSDCNERRKWFVQFNLRVWKAQLLMKWFSWNVSTPFFPINWWKLA